jgi:hypothetical protein
MVTLTSKFNFTHYIVHVADAFQGDADLLRSETKRLTLPGSKAISSRHRLPFRSMGYERDTVGELHIYVMRKRSPESPTNRTKTTVTMNRIQLAVRPSKEKQLRIREATMCKTKGNIS